ncbi:hypothetical protein B0H13DRAFT_2239523 [Mycena leptocephala]|nr:hypothetical protein B0H13DRAFT_2239523 [Mycena leptocephala]
MPAARFSKQCPLRLQCNYAQDISHWASSSTQVSVCTVEPGTAADVSTIYCGGHTANPSSTTGVHISMTRFSGVTYDAASGTAAIGSGLIWDDVYEALAPFGVNVVDGRVSGVGYSWKTNQFGLTVDTVTAFKLVKPNGDIVSVTASSDPDLFFGLKGIVTQFTLKTFPQGGLITYTVAHIPAVSAAIARHVTDPKAGIIPAYNFLLGQPGVSHIMFYDGPTPPAGIFDEFLAIPHLTEDVSTRNFVSLVQSAPSNVTTGARGAFHTVSLLDYSPTLIDAILNETNFWGARLALSGATFISYDIEPFLPSIYTHNTSPSAFPPSRGPWYIPLNLYFAAQHLTDIAVGEGQAITQAPLYTNYALYDTPLERIYGDNVARLRTIKAAVDPDNVMGLAGGFKF